MVNGRAIHSAEDRATPRHVVVGFVLFVLFLLFFVCNGCSDVDDNGKQSSNMEPSRVILFVCLFCFCFDPVEKYLGVFELRPAQRTGIIVIEPA